MPTVVTLRQLLENGVHFGHQTRRWNPKMRRFILTERNGIYMIDLQQSLASIDRAYEFVRETVAHGGTILFVGTKKQGQEAIREQATRVGMPYVNERWLGGMLTNFSTIFNRLQRLKELEQIESTGGDTVRSKKERLTLQRERLKLDRTLGGIRDMTRVPSAIWIVDTKKEHIAVGEARKLGIPVVAILDTNCDPDEVDYPIPGNDDAIRSVALLTRVVADAAAEGLMARSQAGRGQDGSELAVDEPLADWERELLQGSGAPEAAAETAPATTAPVADPAASAQLPAESAPAAPQADLATAATLPSEPVSAADVTEVSGLLGADPAAEFAPEATQPAAAETPAVEAPATETPANETTTDGQPEAPAV